jgi:hypothetical protein
LHDDVAEGGVEEDFFAVFDDREQGVGFLVFGQVDADLQWLAMSDPRRTYFWIVRMAFWKA